MASVGIPIEIGTNTITTTGRVLKRARRSAAQVAAPFPLCAVVSQRVANFSRSERLTATDRRERENTAISGTATFWCSEGLV
jgi:hypothetical protein